MNLDPLSLLLFILFIVIPIVSNLFSRESNRTRPQQRSRPPSEPAPRGQAERRTATQPNTPAAFEKRLEEARRRVQQAMTEQNASPSTQPAAQPVAPSSQSPVGRSLEAPPLRAQSLEDMGLESTERSPAVPRDVRDLDTAPPLRVQRRRAAKPAKLTQRGVLDLDRTSLLGGIIWHEILSEPLAKRNYRRRLSQRR